MSAQAAGMRRGRLATLQGSDRIFGRMEAFGRKVQSGKCHRDEFADAIFVVDDERVGRI